MRIQPLAPLALPRSLAFSTMYEHIARFLLECAASRRASRRRRGKRVVEEGEHLAPTVERLLGAIGRAGGVEEGVAGTVIAVKLVGSAELFQHRLGAVHLIAIGIFVVVAEQAEQRAVQFLGEIDW